jgi:hypothetical protein
MPSIERSSWDDNGWREILRSETGAQREARERMEKQLAEDLGLARPWTAGPSLTKCPGSAPYGHGMSYTVCHSGRCCEAWEAARSERLAEMEAGS